MGMAPKTHHRREGRLGIFWFCGEGRKPSALIGISRLWSLIPTVEEKRCLEIGHELGWTHAQALSGELAAFRFDHFPRGRLEWHSAVDQWRLYLDQKLLRGAFVTEVLLKWHPPKAQLVVLVDSQYRSDASVGSPALPRGV
jgi:hypothetical protein